MALVKLKDFYPDYRNDIFDGNDITGMSVYSGDEKVGTVDNVLLDENSGQFRYLVVDTGFWIFGKRVLLPIGMANVASADNRVYVSGLTRAQVENLPEFNDDLKVDYDYEEEVRNVYRPTVAATPTTTAATPSTYNRDTYDYDREPHFYQMNERNHQNLRLYEERLVANKQRQRAGGVTIGKHVETQTAQVSIPVEKERVVIERNTPAGGSRAVAPGEATFNDQEVARVDVYEETADVQKQAYVREEVNVRKEVEQDTVQASEQVRREELDVNTEGNASINNPRNPRR